MEVYLNTNDGAPLYRQIMQQIEAAIATGLLRPGEAMPPIRVLAQRLLINPNTVLRAYRELEASGLLKSRQGAGTVVSGEGSPLATNAKEALIRKQVHALTVMARNLNISGPRLHELIEEAYRPEHTTCREPGAHS
ncbi:MAG: GntR family transcriptional regulator [Candidatus Hydrogenedentes bacterium]|nr:GntR family transcriptional regulator [Candidatus Hydrogenedentota bacterium]